VPNFIFAITFQSNFYYLFKGLRAPSDGKMATTAFSAVMFCVGSYLLVGILGYNYAGDAIEANFLASFSYATTSKFFYFLLNISYLVSIFCAFPIMFFSCRNNFIVLVKLATTRNRRVAALKREEELEDEGREALLQEASRKKERGYFLACTVLIYLVVVAVAFGVDDIEVVFNAIGSLCSSALSPLLPCFFYFQLVRMKQKPKAVTYYAAIAIFSIILPYSIFSIISLYVR
jgi:amino acid permease